ncbi:DUF4397 domain-containing protein [Neobacillus sp. SM06]|uniref:DUF4397 domain-containing protein n=1 Tax=Neobacillus sp. SM06 TaxID=3422492 RepID=UPI003D2DA126
MDGIVRFGSKAEEYGTVIRFVHAAYKVGNIDIYFNGQLIFHDVSYKSVGGYFPLPPGCCQITVYPSGEKKNSLVNKLLSTEHPSYTLAVVGKAKTVQILPYVNCPEVPAGEAKIRFLHLSSDSPAVDIAVKGRDVVFPRLCYQAATDYLGLTPMTVDLEARVSGGKEVVLPLPKMKFLADCTYSIALIGSASHTPNLEAICLHD